LGFLFVEFVAIRGKDKIGVNSWQRKKMTNEFWHNKRVLVTGGNGFLGKHLVRKLHERGADVFVADIDRYDLRRLEDIRRALSDSKPQMVIHLAARVGGIGANREHPAKFFYDNPSAGSGRAR
jgi:GDP-L-fucose synthase